MQQLAMIDKDSKSVAAHSSCACAFLARKKSPYQGYGYDNWLNFCLIMLPKLITTTVYRSIIWSIEKAVGILQSNIKLMNC